MSYRKYLKTNTQQNKTNRKERTHKSVHMGQHGTTISLWATLRALLLSETQLLQKPVGSSTSLWLARVKACRNRDTSHVTQQILKQKQRAELSRRRSKYGKSIKKKTCVHCFQVSPEEH